MDELERIKLKKRAELLKIMSKPKKPAVAPIHIGGLGEFQKILSDYPDFDGLEHYDYKMSGYSN